MSSSPSAPRRSPPALAIGADREGDATSGDSDGLLPDLPLPALVYDVHNLRIEAVNDAALRAYGYSRTEFLALTVDRLRPEEDRAAFLDHVESSGAHPTRGRWRHLTKDGRCLHVDVIAEPTSRSGRRRVIVLDVSERAAIEDEHARLSHAVEQAAEAILVTDADGVIVYVNPAFEQVTGYTRSETVGRNPRFLKSGRQDAAFYEHMWAVLRRGEVWRGRLVNRRKDGTLFEEEGTISPVRDGNGVITSYVAVKRDVTHERQLEDQVRQSAKMEAVGRLASGVAHDFNNFLNVITGYGELALRRLPAESDVRRHVTEMIRAAQRSAELTRQLLAFSRQRVLQRKVVDLNAALMDIDGLLRRIVGEDIELASLPAPSPLHVSADPGQIEQVIMNLAVNARDAMPGGGRLTLKTVPLDLDGQSGLDVPAGAYAAIVVSDTGCGMDAETRSHIFEPFFTTKGEGRGTGLGLSTVWGIVRQSEGTVAVHSRPGVGTTFKVVLPRVAAPRPAAAAAETPTAPAPRERKDGREIVLVVDDNDALRAVVRDVLDDAGYAVLEASCPSAAFAMEAAHPGPVHLLLTDLVLPEMDGAALARRLREARPGLRVLYMSGQLGDTLSATDHASGFVAKPFTSDALESAVRAALGDYPAQG